MQTRMSVAPAAQVFGKWVVCNLGMTGPQEGAFSVPFTVSVSSCCDLMLALAQILVVEVEGGGVGHRTASALHALVIYSDSRCPRKKSHFKNIGSHLEWVRGSGYQSLLRLWRVCRLRWGLQFLHKLLLLFHTPAQEEAFCAPSTVSVSSRDLMMLALAQILVLEVEGGGVGSRVGSRGHINLGLESGTFGVEKRLVLALLF